MPSLVEDPRRPAALALSLLLHGALLLLLGSRMAVELTPSPSPLVVTIVEAGPKTEGPGAVSAELRLAAPAARAEPVPIPPEPVPAEPVAAPEVREPEPVAVPVPKPAPKTKPVPVPVEKPPARAVAAAVLAPASPSAVLGDAASSAVLGDAASAAGVEGGDGAIASAPSWAPVARVRYEEKLFAWMDRHKQYPLLAQRRRLQGVGSVRIRIDRSGRVLERELETSTGQPLLDEATLDMVRRANPFPAVPPEYAGASFEFVAPIEYRLR